MYVGINTGMNSLIRPALYDAYHRIVNLTRCGNTDATYAIPTYSHAMNVYTSGNL